MVFGLWVGENIILILRIKTIFSYTILHQRPKAEDQRPKQTSNILTQNYPMSCERKTMTVAITKPKNMKIRTIWLTSSCIHGCLKST